MSGRVDGSGWTLDCKVYVGGLELGADKERLRRLFRDYGAIKNIWVARNPPGFAFVKFSEPDEAQAAVKALDGITLYGRRLQIQMSSGRTRSDKSRSRVAPRRYTGLSSDSDWSIESRSKESRSRSRTSSSRSSSISSSHSRSSSFTPESERSTLSKIYRKPYKAPTSSRTGSTYTKSFSSSTYSQISRRRRSDLYSSHSSQYSSHGSVYWSETTHNDDRSLNGTDIDDCSVTTSENSCMIIDSSLGSCSGKRSRCGWDDVKIQKNLRNSRSFKHHSSSSRCSDFSSHSNDEHSIASSSDTPANEGNRSTEDPTGERECFGKVNSEGKWSQLSMDKRQRDNRNILYSPMAEKHEPDETSRSVCKLLKEIDDEKRRNSDDISIDHKSKCIPVSTKPKLQHPSEIEVESQETQFFNAQDADVSDPHGELLTRNNSINSVSYERDGKIVEVSSQTDLYLLLYFVQSHPNVLSETFLRLDRDNVLNSCDYPEIMPSKYKRKSTMNQR